MKKNCWETKNCGREPNGTKVNELGACLATTDSRLDGTHDGKNGGRACWVIAGSSSCFKCEFYDTVRNEEGANFKLSGGLLEQLQ